MTLFNKITFIAIFIFFLTACHSQKNGTPQKEAQSNIGIEDTPDDNDLSEQIDFVMNDVNGKQISVKDEFSKHKLTVIDFWASWCTPCIREMPNLINTYNRYKEYGLNIIGVSLDEDETQWKRAIKNFNITWTQLSDLKGWDNSAAQMYGIQAIPFTILVDKDGNIINAGLRGDDLDAFIRNYLNIPANNIK